MAQCNFIIPTGKEKLDNLSKIEKQITGQVGRGLSNKEIAKKLVLSEGTVRNYISGILSKLNLRDRTQLAILATQIGISIKD